MKIGVLITLHESIDIAQEFQKIKELDLQSCQISVWNPRLYTQSTATALKAAAQETGVEISSLWAGWTGPAVWDFYEGPLTLGLIPSTYRAMRTSEIMAASDFAHEVGIKNVITHAGFLPENPNDPAFSEIVTTLRYLAGYMQAKGQYFLLETGQETPTTLLRTIVETGADNIGVNFDTANLILYGKAASADAAMILGKYVRDTHCKDGLFPVDEKSLGCEVPLGQGRADMPAVLRALMEAGYTGPLTIEREITGEQQIKDIVMARDLLQDIMNEIGIQ